MVVDPLIYNTLVCSCKFCRSMEYSRSQWHNKCVSQSGYIITLGDMPVLWGSRVQTEITFKGNKSEYVSLSMLLWHLLPLQTLMYEICACLQKNTNQRVWYQVSSIWEDKNGSLKLANAAFPSWYWGQTILWWNIICFLEERLRLKKFKLSTLRQQYRKPIFTKG